MRFGDQTLSTGTGFVCETSKGPHLVTNWHNLAGRDPVTKQPLAGHGGIPNCVRITHNKDGILGKWAVKTESLLNLAGGPRWIEHPTFADNADFVALPLLDLDDVQLVPHDLDAYLEVGVNLPDPVSVVGFPFGMTVGAGSSLAIWATGFIASDLEIDFDERPVFLIDCRTRPGQSGSAVIFYREKGATFPLNTGAPAVYDGPVTRVLGIYSGRINEESDLGIVWKVSALRELLAAI